MAAPANAKPLRLSWSKLKEWEDCQAKGHLKAQGKALELRDSRVFFPGTVVDRCMRRWLEADAPVPGAMAGLVEEVLAFEQAEGERTGDGVVRWKGPGDKGQVIADCQECCRRLEPILLEHVVPHEYQCAVRFEVPFNVPHPDGRQVGIILTGEMDLLVRALDHSWLKVMDLKMTKNDDYWRSTFPQLNFYEIAAFAMLRQWPQESWLIQPMCKQPTLPFRFSIEDRRELLARIVRWAEGQWSGSFPPKSDGQWCTDCPVFHACPKFVGEMPGGRVRRTPSPGVLAA
jgi:hypothetical protein